MNNELIYNTLIIGAGHAGLATSYYLKHGGINHLILEQHSIGSSWKNQRWDSFTMNTPNWMTWLPGMPVSGEEWDKFMTGQQFAEYLERYTKTFELPVETGYIVTNLELKERYYAITAIKNETTYSFRAKNVVIASGSLNCVKLPDVSRLIPKWINQIHASQYKNPAQLPDGAVLVVGAGQTGCQLAEELVLAGKKVYLAGSKVPRVPRRYKGKDIMEWMHIMGAMDISTTILRENPALEATQPQVSGGGISGHTVSYQSLHGQGVTILGTLKGFEHDVLNFEDNSADFIKFADDASLAVKNRVDAFLQQYPEIVVPPDFAEDIADLPDTGCKSASHISSVAVGANGISTIIWAAGFGYDFSYLPENYLDDKLMPIHYEGIISESGIYCVGFPWLRKKKSGLVFGIAEDAKCISASIINSLNEVNNPV